MGNRQTEIRISCDTRDTLPFSEIEEFQGNLKKTLQEGNLKNHHVHSTLQRSRR